jgi:hypothetical protein
LEKREIQRGNLYRDRLWHSSFNWGKIFSDFYYKKFCSKGRGEFTVIAFEVEIHLQTYYTTPLIFLS